MHSRKSLVTVAILISLFAAAAFLSSCKDADTAAPESGSSRSASTGGSLKFDDVTFDFGAVVQSQELHHVFQCTNTGTAPISITRIKPVCGCTIPRFSTEPIAPGETANIDLTFQAGSLTGQINKKLTVFTDNPELDPIELNVEGKVQVEFWVEPGQSEFGTLYGGSAPDAKNIRVAWLKDVELEVTSIDTTSDSVKILSQTPFEKDDTRGIDVQITLEDWEKDIDATRTDQ